MLDRISVAIHIIAFELSAVWGTSNNIVKVFSKSTITLSLVMIPTEFFDETEYPSLSLSVTV